MKKSKDGESRVSELFPNKKKEEYVEAAAHAWAGTPAKNQ